MTDDIYELEACRVATLPVPGWECFFGRHDLDFYPLSFYVWIVRGNGRTGLIDTGLPLDEAERRRLGEACQSVDPRSTFRDVVSLDRLLEKQRLAPESIDFVLVTQTITYHTGGLVAELLPRAHVYMARAGMMDLLLEDAGHPPRDMYFTEASWLFLRKLLVENRLHLVDTTEVAPGLVFETTGGHHPGSAGVRVRTGQGIVGILESAFLQSNMDQGCPIGIAENVSMCREAIRRYRRECNLALAGHDPSLAERFPPRTIP